MKNKTLTVKQFSEYTHSHRESVRCCI